MLANMLNTTAPKLMMIVHPKSSGTLMWVNRLIIPVIIDNTFSWIKYNSSVMEPSRLKKLFRFSAIMPNSEARILHMEIVAGKNNTRTKGQ